MFQHIFPSPKKSSARSINYPVERNVNQNFRREGEYISSEVTSPIIEDNIRRQPPLRTDHRISSAAIDFATNPDRSDSDNLSSQIRRI